MSYEMITLNFPIEDGYYLIDIIEDMIDTHTDILRGYIDDEESENRDYWIPYHTYCVSHYKNLLDKVKPLW